MVGQVKGPMLPGRNVSATLTLAWLGGLALVPIVALVVRAVRVPTSLWLHHLCDARVLSALGLSVLGAALAALIASALGLLVAWLLVRHRFAGRWLMDALVDLPFALPTAVAGIALTALWAPEGPLGGLLLRWLGVHVAFSRIGVVLALVFVGLPFVVRTVQPVLADLDDAVEEAAACLGASAWQVFAGVVLPALRPALQTGYALAFARAVGEFGSVVFIAGNIPARTEIAPLLVVTRLEEYDYDGATVVAVALLASALLVLAALARLRGRGGEP